MGIYHLRFGEARGKPHPSFQDQSSAQGRGGAYTPNLWYHYVYVPEILRKS